MAFQPKNVNFSMVLNLVDINQYHSPPKKSLQNFTYNLNFELYLQFFILCDVYFFDTNIFYMFKFVKVC
jgi:hypothetical protein